MKPCHSCGAELVADGKKNAMDHYHVICKGCKRGFYVSSEFLNDGRRSNLGDFI